MPIVAAVVAALALAQFFCSRQFAAEISGLVRRLAATQLEPSILLRVPASMRAFALRNGGRIGGPSTVTMIQAAEMRLSINPQFFRLAASQVSGTRTPSFVWHAKGAMSQLIPLRLVDSCRRHWAPRSADRRFDPYRDFDRSGNVQRRSNEVSG